MYNNSGNMNSQQMLGGQGGGGSFLGSGGAGAAVPGGLLGGNMDRRPSLGSNNNLPLDASLSEMLGRRSSMGYDGGMEMMGRRESVDPTAAMLDACIMDLTRRRRSMSMHPGAPGAGGLQNDMGFAGQGNSMGGFSNDMGLPAAATLNAMGGRNSEMSSAMAMRELQHQQAEIERRRDEIELQRQQLLANLQESPAMQPMGGIPAGLNGMPDMPGDDMGMQNAPSNPSQQWWVCQICNSKAFASRDEAMDHEAVCNLGALNQQPQQPPVNMQNMQSSSYQQQQPLHDNVDPETYAHIPNPIPLAMPTDKDWLTPLHCFVRRHCVEIFSATPDDVATPSKGKRKPIQVGQVGIRCPHCSMPGDATGQRERGSVYYPTTISSIYNATMNLLQRHLHTCPCVPVHIMQQYQNLKQDDARSGTSKKYWVESALSMGLVDTPTGIRFSTLTPPPLPKLSHQQHSTGAKRRNDDFFSPTSNATSPKKSDDPAGRGEKNSTPSGEKGGAPKPSAPLVTPEDKPYATGFSYHLLCQMQPCVFTEADRLGKRKGLPAGFAGLACSHCFGGYGSGRFFPSSIKTLSDTSKTLNVLHNHMMRCRKCPQEVRDALEKLRVHHDDERAKMKFGSQKAFFARIWARLHGSSPTNTGVKRKQPYSSYPADMKHNPMMPQNYLQQMGMMGGMGLGGLDVLSMQAASAASESPKKRHRGM